MSVKHYDLEQGQGYDSGGAYMREETNGGDYVRSEDYAALEKLCQQQHEALDSLCDDIELGCGCDGNGDVFDLAVAENALAAYAALFPKTGGAKGETKP